MLIRRIRFGEQLYIVRHSVRSGMLPDPWGDDPGCPDEVNISGIEPQAPRHVWDYCQGYLEAECEMQADHFEECKADYQRTGGEDE